MKILISMYDIRSFFDAENLTDVLSDAYSCKVKFKIYRLIYGMNRKKVIRIQTAVGTTSPQEIPEGLSQGSLDGAVLSAGSLGVGDNSYFCDSKYEIFYGGIRIQPILWQDDCLRMSSSLLDAQAGNEFLQTVLKGIY